MSATWISYLHTLGVAWTSIACVRLMDNYWPKPISPAAAYWLMLALGMSTATFAHSQ